MSAVVRCLGLLAALAIWACGPDEPSFAPPQPDLADLGDRARQDVEDRRRQLLALVKRGGDPEALSREHGELAMRYHAYNLRNEARWHYQQAIESGPDVFRWRYYLGRLLQQQTELDAANASFLEGHRLDGDHVPTLVVLGEYLRKRERFEEAGAYFQKAYELKRDCVYAMVGLAQIAIAGKRYDRALALLAEGIELQPEGTVLYYLSAMAARGKGDIEAAETFLARRAQSRGATVLEDPLMDQIDALGDEDARLLFEADQAMARGARDQAIEGYRASLALNPNSHEARVKLGFALLQARDLEGAEREYRAALALHGGVAMVHYNLGGIYVELGREEEGVEQLRLAVKFNPAFPEARLLLADALRRSGDFDGAAQHYAEAVALEPADKAARLGRALSLIRLERWREARTALEEDVAANAGEAVFQHALARLLAACPLDELRDPERAARLLEGLVKTSEPNLELAESTAMAMASLGRFDLAQRWQRQAIDIAYRAGRMDAAQAMQRNLSLYRQGTPCREPWRKDDPLFSMPTYRR